MRQIAGHHVWRMRPRSLWPWYINIVIEFRGIIHRLFFCIETQSVGDWILYPSSDKSVIIWVQSIELVLISGYQHQQKTKYKPNTTQTIGRSSDKHYKTPQRWGLACMAMHNLTPRVYTIRVLSALKRQILCSTNIKNYSRWCFVLCLVYVPCLLFVLVSGDGD
jgi:hypothetical protein